MTIEIVRQGDIPEFRQTSRQVTEFNTNLSLLLANLVETLQYHRALGLSAPQIHVPERVIVLDIGNGVQEFINPEILETSGEVEAFESCLSFPGHTLKIRRPKWIRMQAQNRLGQRFEIEASDLLARVLCHEVDHLNGVLFVDHLSEEEMFSELLNQVILLEEQENEKPNKGGTQTEEQTEAPLPTPMAAEQQARRQELQLSLDMLAELSWKLALSVEILKDYKDMFTKMLPWNRLEEINELLEETISIIEESLSEQ